MVIPSLVAHKIYIKSSFLCDTVSQLKNVRRERGKEGKTKKSKSKKRGKGKEILGVVIWGRGAGGRGGGAGVGRRCGTETGR